MSAIILDGKKLSEEIYQLLIKKIDSLEKKIKRLPKISIILIGEDIASHTYVNYKAKACLKININYEIIKRPSSITQKELINEVIKLNKDDHVDGILVQLPLPDHININSIINTIDPTKDVDGFHPVNYGKMALGLPCHKPATPSGILEFFKSYRIETKGKNCVVIGRSRIVGAPMSIMMSSPTYPGNCTVTLCHSQTKNIEKFTKQADILISAIGKNKFINGEMIKKGAVVIDVGINKVPDSTKSKGYRLEGDVIFDEVFQKTSYITPVPGGVGPMTIAALLKNTYNAAYDKSMNK
ncbi:MAG: bifunctional 5,10-methylenetetrahydrofolate dehydrogenase/5,10-methenyltetrahydrofolate cyclohydrolase [Bacteroidetes bacterium]|nr:bifunctional 5,10-methylenetetrahydrofolate dehydrogenase/5,10-methenyltetrahydrofolate cyclohydrolase [Bacteroidota bacterium]